MEQEYDDFGLGASLPEIRPFLEAAYKFKTILQHFQPSTRDRSIYCILAYALTEAHRLEPFSKDLSVGQFIYNLRRHLYPLLLEEDDPSLRLSPRKFTLKDWVKPADAETMKIVSSELWQSVSPRIDDDRALSQKPIDCTLVYFHVTFAICEALAVDIGSEFLSALDKLHAKIGLVPYNIIPHKPNDAFNIYPQIRPATNVLGDTQGLEWHPNYQQKLGDVFVDDILDWLKVSFGFQEDSVRNQREHLLMLLTDQDQRGRFLSVPNQTLIEHYAIRKVQEKLLENVKKWCDHLNLEEEKENHLSHLYRPSPSPQHDLLYMALYLLIWGEAANLRFMPECLCYIYYHMTKILYALIEGGGITEATRYEPEGTFLKETVTPIYEVINKEAARSKQGKSHSDLRNYDDLNEYFWSKDCFKLGWPMEKTHEFFRISGENGTCARKVNFVEIRSFLNIFRSFDRMWTVLILFLQAMIVIAWSESWSSGLLKKVSTVFITNAVLDVGRGALDVIFNWKLKHSSPRHFKLCIGKVISAVVLVIFLVKIYVSWPSMFILAVGFYYGLSFLWPKPLLYVGRGMHEEASSQIKYTIFWLLLSITKFIASYYIEIEPLVGPTKIHLSSPLRFHNLYLIGDVIALWLPVIIIYFMDPLVWYAIFSTVVGLVQGALGHVGLIHMPCTLRMCFESLPGGFNSRLIHADNAELEVERREDKRTVRFALVWNTMIRSFRVEDLINNREEDLLLFPDWADRDFDGDLDLVQWPPFLVANKIPVALDMIKGSTDKKAEKRIEDDKYMYSAFRECYALSKNLFKFMARGPKEKKIIKRIIRMVDKLIVDASLVEKLKTCAPTLCNTFVTLLKFLLKNKRADRNQVVSLFQEMLKIMENVLADSDLTRMIGELMMCKRPGIEELIALNEHQLFASAEDFMFPLTESVEDVKKKIKRLDLLLTINLAAMDVPSNLEVRRRIYFFLSSLFMDIPPAPKVWHMLSFSVLTPYYTEDVLLDNLEKANDDGVSILFYLQRVFPDEWRNFVERLLGKKSSLESRKILEDIKSSAYSSEIMEEIRLWASYRGQTLTRTVRGMMYFRRALEFQNFLDVAKDEDVMDSKDQSNERMELFSQCQAAADMKFTYVVSCQLYAIHKRDGDPRAKDILRLMKTYPSLRVAYIDEVEETIEDGSQTKNQKAYYSTLVKAGYPTDQVIYRIRLPGPAILGEGKPENQNHAIIFTRGECLMTIDMNQDNYMEEAFKIRNLLQEFLKRARPPTILGLREHIFSGSVSSLAWFMSNQESTFVTACQRVFANLLRVRFHYGHPDVFDRLFHLTRGGISKASRTINLSEDIFAGFNSTLRGGNVTHHEYIQVGKGRDVGLNQISMFEAKVSSGNAEQIISRDIYRLGQRYDFFRMLSCYFTTVGFYCSSLAIVLSVYVFLYGRIFLAFRVETDEISKVTRPIQAMLTSVGVFQLGFVMTLPMVVQMALEHGFKMAIINFMRMQVQLAPVMSTFTLGTHAHYLGRTLLHGGAKYRSTGRGFVIHHTTFVENYRLYSRSHFVKGVELLLLIGTVKVVAGDVYKSSAAFFLTASTWFLVGTWLFAPFLFNPSGFEWHKVVDDWKNWSKWISRPGGTGVKPDDSWESWWEEEQEHLQHSGVLGFIAEVLLSLRFVGFLCMFLYFGWRRNHLKGLCCGWILCLGFVSILKAHRVLCQEHSVRRLVACRLFSRVFNLIFVPAAVVLLLMLMHKNFIQVRDIISMIPIPWCILLICQNFKHQIKKIDHLWSIIRDIARCYDIMMGFILFAPIAVLAWFPLVSDFQTRILFNQGFSRDLMISRLTGGQRS